MKHLLLCLVFLLCGCRPEARKEALSPFSAEQSGKSTAPAAEDRPRTLWGSRIQLTRGNDGEDAFPFLSADGKTLYFATSRFGKNFNLVSRPLDGYTLSFLTSGEANDIFPSLSPDQRTIAFASDREQGWDIHLVDLGDTSKIRRLVRSTADTLGPRWSPDGRSLACFRRGSRGKSWEIWTIEVAGGKQTYLAEGLFPDWSPQGDWIVYQRPRSRGNGWYSLWKIRADGSQATELISGWNGDWGAVRPSWSPDGQWIAFIAVGKGSEAKELNRQKGTLYVISADGSKLLNLTGDRPDVSEWDPHFGKDWRIYFSSDEGGGINVWSIGASFK